MKVTINIDENEQKVLEKRAKKNFLTLQQQIEDIIRRSAVRDKKTASTDKIDDKLIAAFSRDARGRKRQ